MKKLFWIFIALSISTFVFSNVSHAQNSGKDKTLSPYFFVKSNNPDIDQLPLKSTKANVNIAGAIADVTITQVYQNNGTTPLEAIYVFPASTKAAVYGMTMKIGDRTIIAKIKERSKAREQYNKAKKQGKRVSLLQQERPNVFQMEVANIMPDDIIELELKYTEMLVPTDGVYQFVYPAVVGPRYGKDNKTGESNDYVSSPYLKMNKDVPYDFDLNVNLNAGMTIQDICSTSHKIDIDYKDLSSVEIALNDMDKNAGNRDFILDYQLAGGEINSGLLLYKGEKENFFTLIVQPPKKVNIKQIPPREYIFIMDVSGSMAGFPIEVSKKLIRNLISNLRPTDRFNVLLFAASSFLLSEKSLYANKKNIRSALDVIDKQRGGGGTELNSAMMRALKLPKPDIDFARSLIILTDGYISVERQTFDLISKNLNKANVFAFGIGRSVNRHLIEGIASVGHGEPFVVTSKSEANKNAENFRKYISSPVLTGIKAYFSDFDAYDIEPASIQDVFAKRPVMIYGKWRGKPKGNIQITGYTGNGPYYKNFAVARILPDKNNVALKYLWARQKIKALDDYKRFGTNKAQVTELGLKYNLMTAYTSFIAVDNQNNNIDNLHTVKQPLPMPAGVSNLAVGAELSIEGITRMSKSAGKKKSTENLYENKIYSVWDTMYVWAKRGLNLRAEPNTKAKILNKIPFGTRVIILQKSNEIYFEKMVDNKNVRHLPYGYRPISYVVKGNWVKVVTATGKIGYIIDQYLLHLKPLHNSKIVSSDLNIKLLKSDTISYNFGPYVNYGYFKVKNTYKYGIMTVFEKNKAEEESLTYKFDNMSLAEAFVLATSSWKSTDNLLAKSIDSDSLSFRLRDTMIYFKKKNDSSLKKARNIAYSTEEKFICNR